LQQELVTWKDDRHDAEQRIQSLNEDYFAAVNSDERRRIASMQGQAVADRGGALQMIDRLQRQMRDVENDYLITGCYEELGRL
jgi:hypothetical protein